MRQVRSRLGLLFRLAAVHGAVLLALSSMSASRANAAAEEACPIQCSDADRPIVEKIWRAWKKREDAFKSVKITWDMSAYLEAPDKAMLPPGASGIEKSGVYPVKGTTLVLDKSRLLYKYCRITDMPKAAELDLNCYRFENGVSSDYAGGMVQILKRQAGVSQPFAELYPILAFFLPLHSIGGAMEPTSWRVVTKDEIATGHFSETLTSLAGPMASSELVCVEVHFAHGTRRHLTINQSESHCPLILLEEYMASPPSTTLHFSMRFIDYRVESDRVATPLKWDFSTYSPIVSSGKPIARYDCTVQSVVVNTALNDGEFELPPFKMGTFIQDYQDMDAPKYSVMTETGVRPQAIDDASQPKVSRFSRVWPFVANTAAFLAAVVVCFFALRRVRGSD